MLFYLSLPLMALGAAAAVGPLLVAMRHGDAWNRDAEAASAEAMRFRAPTEARPSVLAHNGATHRAKTHPAATRERVLVGAADPS